MTQRKPYPVRKIINAQCHKCSHRGVALLCDIGGYLWCIPCLREHKPDLYKHLYNYVGDNPPPNDE